MQIGEDVGGQRCETLAVELGHRNHSDVGGVRGVYARDGVFENDGLARCNAEFLGRDEEDVGSGFRVGDGFARDDDIEVRPELEACEHLLDEIRRRGGCDGEAEAEVAARVDEFKAPWLQLEFAYAGHECFDEERHASVDVHAEAVSLHRTDHVGQAAADARQRELIGPRDAVRFRQRVLDPPPERLAVHHQPVHVKNQRAESGGEHAEIVAGILTATMLIGRANPRTRRVLVYAAVLAAMFALVRGRFEAPVARESAPNGEFAAGRAFEVLRRVLGDERPHPRGSEANRAVRARIEAELRRLGLEPRVDRLTGCSGKFCADVENVVATIAGTSGKDEALLLACHYDSVPTGPGASDDGAGIATLLEVAHALVTGGAVERDVVLLFDDGEEAGMLGAEAFVRTSREFARIGAVINVEARGTEGPSMMFETKHVRLGGIRAMARALTRPVTSSLFGGVYERMPNDTDLTVFGRAGVPGFNFAFIRGVERYHRRDDDLRHLSSQSLQHHGDNVLGMTRVFGRADTRLRAAEGEPRAVWFDVLSLFVVSWPEPWSVWIALAETALLLFAVRKRVRAARAWAIFAGAGVVVSLAFVQASYLFVAPGVVAAIGFASVARVAEVRRERAADVLTFCVWAVCAMLWLEVILGVRDAFG